MSTSLENAFSRIVESFARLNAALGSIQNQLTRVHDNLRDTSERREREFEILRQATTDIKQSILILSQQLTEARADLEKIDDKTPPLGVPLLAERALIAKTEHREKRDSGSFSVDKQTIRIPKSWFAALPIAWKLLATVGTVLAALSGWVYHLVHGR